MSTPSTSTPVTAEPLTIAYIALGAQSALQKLQEANPAADYAARFEGEMDYIDRVIEHADLVETKALNVEFSGVFLYEVAEEFGAQYGESLFGTPLEPSALADRLIREAL